MGDPLAEAMIGHVWLKGRLQYSSDPDGAGEVVGYYESGALSFRYPLQNGTINGRGRTWYENGALKCEEYCRDGALHGPAHYWYSSGVMEKEKHYRCGALRGTQKEWYPNGALKTQSVFVNEALHGPVMEWYPDGKVRSQMNFIQGRKHGLHKFFHEDGTLQMKEIYVRGVRMPFRKYEKLLAGYFSAKKILSIQNQAIRSIFVEEFGYARFLAEMSHEVIEREGEQELVRIHWDEHEEPICLVKVKCPSTGAFYTLRVPPGRRTVRSAIAWTFDISVDDYAPEKET